MAGVVDFKKMQSGSKGSGKHWTKEEIEKRASAASSFKRKKPVKLRMPDWLNEDAAKVWKKTLKDMKEFEILDKVDEDMLAAYCDTVAKYKDANEKIDGAGYTVMGAMGSEIVNPTVKVAQSYLRLMLQYSEKLGLTANARARLAKKMADGAGDPNADLFD